MSDVPPTNLVPLSRLMLAVVEAAEAVVDAKNLRVRYRAIKVLVQTVRAYQYEKGKL